MGAGAKKCSERHYREADPVPAYTSSTAATPVPMAGIMAAAPQVAPAAGAASPVVDLTEDVAMGDVSPSQISTVESTMEKVSLRDVITEIPPPEILVTHEYTRLLERANSLGLDISGTKWDVLDRIEAWRSRNSESSGSSSQAPQQLVVGPERVAPLAEPMGTATDTRGSPVVTEARVASASMDSPVRPASAEAPQCGDALTPTQIERCEQLRGRYQTMRSECKMMAPLTGLADPDAIRVTSYLLPQLQTLFGELQRTYQYFAPVVNDGLGYKDAAVHVAAVSMLQKVTQLAFQRLDLLRLGLEPFVWFYFRATAVIGWKDTA